VESAVNEIIAKRMNKKQTSCPFPARGTYGREVKARALPWTRQGQSPWNQPVGVCNIRLIPSSDDPVAALKG
jgi:hypothetical protein